MSNVMQRPTWGGVPVKGGDFFILRKRKGDTEHVAIRELWSHLFGCGN